MSVLKATDVHMRYPDGTQVLQGLHLEVGKGESVAILGENASGKTTLLKLLAGLIRPTSGEILIDHGPVLTTRDRTGIVLQNPDHQMIAGSVEEELALGLELRGVPQDEMKERVQDQLRAFNLESLREASPESLSGGQKQRVAVAAVMIYAPDFLLLDEPDSLLDAPSRAELESAVDVVRQRCGIVWTCPHPRRMPSAQRRCELRGGTLIPL